MASRKTVFGLALMVLCLALVSCKDTTTEDALNILVTLQASETPEASYQPEGPAVLPNPSPTSAPTQILPTPSFPALKGDTLALADFLFTTNGSGCQLPCWKGLEIGQSGPSHVQQLFDTEFGFDGTLDFFRDNPIANYTAIETAGIPGTYSTGYYWPFAGGDIRLLFAFDSDTDVLSGIVFGWSVESVTVNLTPHRVLQELGPPSWAYASVNETMIEDTAETRLLLAYAQGISFYFAALAPWDLGGTNQAIVDYCLDDANIHVIGNVFLTEPFEDSLNNLTTFQDETVGRILRAHRLAPINETFGVTEQEMYASVEEGADACLNAPLP